MREEGTTTEKKRKRAYAFDSISRLKRSSMSMKTRTQQTTLNFIIGNASEERERKKKKCLLLLR